VIKKTAVGRADYLGMQATFQSGEGKYKPAGPAIQNKTFNPRKCRLNGEVWRFLTEIQHFCLYLRQWVIIKYGFT
jgi:hypothetical protein